MDEWPDVCEVCGKEPPHVQTAWGDFMCYDCYWDIDADGLKEEGVDG